MSAAAAFLRTTRRTAVLFTARRTRARPAALRTPRRTAVLLTARRTLARPTALRTARRATALRTTFRATTRRTRAVFRARRRETLRAIRRSRPRATAPRTPGLVAARFATRLVLLTLRATRRTLLLATPRPAVFLIVALLVKGPGRMNRIVGAAQTTARCLQRAALVSGAAFAPASREHPLKLHP